MKTISISIFLIFLIFSNINASPYDNTKVKVLNLEGIEEELAFSEKIWLVNFHKKGCSESEKLEDPLIKVADALDDIYQAQIASIDVEQYPEVEEKYNITKTPTLLFFAQQKEKKPRPYRGKKQLENILNFMTEECLYAAFKKAGKQPYRFNHKREMAEFKRNMLNVLSEKDIEALRKEKLDEEERLEEIKAKKAKYYEVEDHVAVLTDDNFDNIVLKNEDLPIFVLFYAPWCGHCKALKPTFKDLALKVQGKAIVAQLDCTQNGVTAGKFSIKGYPTVYKFPVGKKSAEGAIEYNGNRQLDDLEQFLFKDEVPQEKSEAKPTKEAKEQEEKIELDQEEKHDIIEKKYDTDGDVAILTDDNYDEVVTKNTKDAIFILFYAPWCGHCKALKPKWKDLATKLKGKPVIIAQVDCTKESKVASKFTISGYPTLKKFPKGSKRSDSLAVDYEGDREVEDLEEFILEIEDDSPIDETHIKAMKRDQFGDIVNDQKNMYFVLFFEKECDKKCEKMLRPFANLATQFKNKQVIKFITMDLDEDTTIRSEFDLTRFPTLVWFPEGEKNKETIDQYTGSSKLPKLKSYVEEKERDKPTPDVFILTDDNFEETVLLSEKQVFLMAYAPWCGHCKAMKPTFGELATNFKDNEDIIIAKIDATKHRKALENYEVKGYPTVLLFPYGNKEGVTPISYDGDRSYSDLESFNYKHLLEAKPLVIPQIVSQEIFDQQCKKSSVRACFIAFLPHIYDSSAAERNQLIEIIKSVAESNKKTFITFSWAQGGDYFDFEDNLNLSSGYPLFMVYAEKKQAIAVMKASFKENHLNTFVEKIVGGRETVVKVTKALPKLHDIIEWDGEDAKPQVDDHEEL